MHPKNTSNWTMVDRRCEWCDTPFQATATEVRRGNARFCCHRCAGLARRNPGLNSIATESDHFWSRVDKRGPEDCWEWQGSTPGFGHGRFHTLDGKYVYAHRYSYELNHGPVPADLYVCHTCDNPPCVNPAHLFLGTHHDNMGDMRAKGRERHLVGSDHQNAKLSEEDVAEIRRLYKGQRGQMVDLARRYGVGKTTIRRIIDRESWKHVP